MLGVDAAFDRMATMQNRAVKHSLKLFAHRDQDLALYQINVCDHLSDGMFNLDARVHLDEVELAVLVHQKFDGAGVDVADVGERAAEHLADFFAELWRDLRGRGFFEQLLMAALNTALALTQTGNGAVLVGENLEFDVAGMLDVLLHVKVAVAKRSGCFGLRGIKSAGSSCSERTILMPRPPPPAEALMITGKPTVRAHSMASPSPASTPSEPGRIGTPAFFMAPRAFSFSPIRRVTSGGGPMNLMLQVSQTSAKLAFSE